MQDLSEIDLKQLVLTLIRKWWLIALCALVMAGAAYFYTAHFITPMYRASVSIYVNNATKVEQMDAISGNNLATSQRLVKTYINIIKSDTVLQRVVEKADLNYSAAAIRGMMTAASVEDTEIFEIQISNADPKVAAKIANAVADVAPEEIANFLEGSSTKIIDYATVPQFRYTPSYRKNTMVGLAVGAVAAMVYIVLRTILDVRIKNEEDLERLFDLPVLGTIPEFGVEYKSGKGYHRYGGHRYGYGYGYGTPPEQRGPHPAEEEASGDDKPD